MIVGALLTSLVIAREYESGTMETIRSLPIRPAEFLTGKALPYFFIGLTDVLAAILMGRAFVRRGHEIQFLADDRGLGHLSLRCPVYRPVDFHFDEIPTGSQSDSHPGDVLPSLLLSNFVFPVENMPPVFKLITCIVPATYYIDILNGLYLRNLDLFHLWSSYLVLMGMFFFCSAA